METIDKFQKIDQAENISKDWTKSLKKCIDSSGTRLFTTGLSQPDFHSGGTFTAGFSQPKHFGLFTATKIFPFLNF